MNGVKASLRVAHIYVWVCMYIYIQNYINRFFFGYFPDNTAATAAMDLGGVVTGW